MELIKGFASNQPKPHYKCKHSSKVIEFLAVPPSMSLLHWFYLNPPLYLRGIIHNTTKVLQEKKKIKLHHCMSPLKFSRGLTLILAVLVPVSTLSAGRLNKQLWRYHVASSSAANLAEEKSKSYESFCKAIVPELWPQLESFTAWVKSGRVQKNEKQELTHLLQG